MEEPIPSPTLFPHLSLLLLPSPHQALSRETGGPAVWMVKALATNQPLDQPKLFSRIRKGTAVVLRSSFGNSFGRERIYSPPILLSYEFTNSNGWELSSEQPSGTAFYNLAGMCSPERKGAPQSGYSLVPADGMCRVGGGKHRACPHVI